MNKRIFFFRVLFLIIFVFLGLFLEHLYYKKKYSIPKNAPTIDKNITQILIVGSSVAEGVEGQIAKFLKNLKPEMRFEVRSFIMAGLTSADALAYHTKLIQTFNPDFILYLLGCIDYEKTHLKNPQATASSKIEEFNLEISQIPDGGHFFERGSPTLQNYANKLNSILKNNADSGELSKLALSISKLVYFMSPEQLVELDRTIEEQLNLSIKNGLSDWELYWDYLNFGYLVSRWIAKIDLPTNKPEQEFYKRYYEKKFGIADLQRLSSEFYVELERALTFPVKNDCSLYFTKSEKLKKYDRYWICGLMYLTKEESGAARRKKLSELIIIPKWHTLGIVPGVTLKNLPYKKIIHGDLGLLFEKVVDNDAALDSASNSATTYGAIKTDVARSNFEKIKAVTADAIIVFLHPPNVNSPAISRLGKELNIPVIDNIGVFERTIIKNDYEKYFRDKVCGSGHMTEMGNNAYSKHVVEKLLPIILRSIKNRAD